MDAEILLCSVLKRNRTWLLAHSETQLSSAEQQQWSAFTLRRRSGEPTAYITGEQEFYGRDFFVDLSVLIPRHATEQLVQTTLGIIQGDDTRQITTADEQIVIATCIWGDIASARTIADIGTGSGCIAVTLACERPDLRLIATDISAEALRVAKRSAMRHGVPDQIRFSEGKGLSPLLTLEEPFLVVSNPPYIPEGARLMREVIDYEPHQALFGGQDGSSVIQSIMKDARQHPHCVGVVIECMDRQAFLIARPTSTSTGECGKTYLPACG